MNDLYIKTLADTFYVGNGRVLHPHIRNGTVILFDEQVPILRVHHDGVTFLAPNNERFAVAINTILKKEKSVGLTKSSTGGMTIISPNNARNYMPGMFWRSEDKTLHDLPRWCSLLQRLDAYNEAGHEVLRLNVLKKKKQQHPEYLRKEIALGETTLREYDETDDICLSPLLRDGESLLGTYRHFKGDLYEVVNIVLDATNIPHYADRHQPNREMVLYHPQGAPEKLFVRTKNEFFNAAQHPTGSGLTPRFLRFGA